MKYIICAVALVLSCVIFTDTYAHGGRGFSRGRQQFNNRQQFNHNRGFSLQINRGNNFNNFHNNRNFQLQINRGHNDIQLLKQNFRAYHEVPNAVIVEQTFIDQHGNIQRVQKLQRLNNNSNHGRGQLQLNIRSFSNGY